MAAEVFNDTMRIVALVGRDDFLVPYFTRQLLEVLEAAHGEIERFDFDGDRVAVADVLDELRTYGLLQPHKLVVVDNAEKFLAASGEGSGPSKARTLMEQYAAAPVEQSTLLLRAPTWNRGKLDKAIAAVGIVHKIKPLSQPDTMRWVAGRAEKAHGVTIEPAAVKRLVRRVGTDLARLDAQLATLAAMTGDAQAVTSALVDDAVPLSREEKAWVIQEALLTGGAARGLRVVRELLDVSRQSDVLVTWAVTDMLKRLHAAARMSRSGASPGEMRKALKLWGPAGDATVSMAASVDPAVLARLLGSALDHQQRLRRGIGRADRMLDMMIVEISEALAA